MWRKGKPPRNFAKTDPGGDGESSTRSSSSSLQWMMKGPLQGLHPSDPLNTGSDADHDTKLDESEGHADLGHITLQEPAETSFNDEKMDVDGSKAEAE